MKLFNVLKCYANFDKEVGYSSGMSFITACFVIVDNNLEVNILFTILYIQKNK
jgi:hypothetical protein